MSEEHVLCIPRSEFDALGSFQGISLNVDRYLPLLTHPKLEFRPRSSCEKDPAFKQLIPFHLILRSGRLLRYWRVRGDERLASRASVGIGGHLNSEDCKQLQIEAGDLVDATQMAQAYLVGEGRELSEELEIATPGGIKNMIVGFVNDDESDEIGTVHLGVIHLVELDDMGGVSSQDPAIELGGFHSPHDLRFNKVPDCYRAPFDTWSGLILGNDISSILHGGHGRPYPFFDHASE